MTPKAVQIIAFLSISCIVFVFIAIYTTHQYDKAVSTIWEMRKDHQIKVSDLETQLNLCQTGRAVKRHIDSSMNELRKKLGQ